MRIFNFQGGYFPTPYTHQPELVMSDRRRSRGGRLLPVA